jgi:hypothetical protein
MAFLASPGGQAAASAAIGILASQSPQSAAGVRAGIGALGTFQDLSDRGSVAAAMREYSGGVDETVDREMLDRSINEGVVSSGAETPSVLSPGGPFIMGGPAPTTFGGTSAQELESHAAAARVLPSVAQANPSQAGWLLAESARRAPTPGPAEAKPNLMQSKEYLEMMFPGHKLSARMTDGGFAVSADEAKPEPKPTPEPAQYTKEQLAQARETVAGLDPGVSETVSVLGPGGAKRTISGRGPALPAGGGAGGSPTSKMIQVTIAGTEFLYDPSTGEYLKIPPEVLEQFAEVQAIKEAGGLAGTVIRNADGTTTIRR